MWMDDSREQRIAEDAYERACEASKRVATKPAPSLATLLGESSAIQRIDEGR
jgi:hypothetical protein